MEILIGAVLALSVGFSATFIGLDRDRAFYPTVMVVIASYYALFAVTGGSIQVLVIESIVIVAFLAARRTEAFDQESRRQHSALIHGDVDRR